MAAIFLNRRDGGKKLSSALQKYRDEDVVVLGIPRGGVVVASEVAQGLEAPLDVIIPRKIGAPHNPEVAIGAVSQDGTIIRDEAMVRLMGISDDCLSEMAQQVTCEIARRVDAYRGGRPGLNLEGKTVIVVDDGIATGFTIQAALKFVRGMNPKKLILAVPVGPADSIGLLREKADEVICLETPREFYAVGQFYRDFDQTTDEEVIQALDNMHKVY